MHLNPDAALIVLRVELHGNQAVRYVDMALDTGATYVMIPTGVAEELGYNPSAAGRHVNVATVSSVESTPLITIDRIETLGAHAVMVDAICFDLPIRSNIQGLLGLSFLKHFDVDLHFRDRELSLR